MTNVLETIGATIRARREAAVVDKLTQRYGYFPPTGIWRSELRNHLQEADSPQPSASGIIYREICRQLGEKNEIPILNVVKFVQEKSVNFPPFVGLSDIILAARDLGWFTVDLQAGLIGRTG